MRQGYDKEVIRVERNTVDRRMRERTFGENEIGIGTDGNDELFGYGRVGEAEPAIGGSYRNELSTWISIRMGGEGGFGWKTCWEGHCGFGPSTLLVSVGVGVGG